MLKMMDSNDTILIQDLTDLFNSQLLKYRELRDLVRKALSRLILSRGDMSVVMDGLEKKKKIFEAIDLERTQHADLVQQYQSRKASLNSDASINALNALLDDTGIAIQEFLNEEEQLKKYIEGILKKESSKVHQ